MHCFDIPDRRTLNYMTSIVMLDRVAGKLVEESFGFGIDEGCRTTYHHTRFCLSQSVSAWSRCDLCGAQHNTTPTPTGEF
jgi:hypothetical protein